MCKKMHFLQALAPHTQDEATKGLPIMDSNSFCHWRLRHAKRSASLIRMGGGVEDLNIGQRQISRKLFLLVMARGQNLPKIQCCSAASYVRDLTGPGRVGQLPPHPLGERQRPLPRGVSEQLSLGSLIPALLKEKEKALSILERSQARRTQRSSHPELIMNRS